MVISGDHRDKIPMLVILELFFGMMVKFNSFIFLGTRSSKSRLKSGLSAKKGLIRVMNKIMV